MVDDYTPSVADGQSYYVAGRAQIQRQITGEHAQDITPYSYEFDRMITQVRAEAFREAAQTLRTGLRGGACNEGCHKADRITLEMRADRIEREAGL